MIDVAIFGIAAFVYLIVVAGMLRLFVFTDGSDD